MTIELAGSVELRRLESLFAALFWDPSDFPEAVRRAHSDLSAAGSMATAIQQPDVIRDDIPDVIQEPDVFRAKGVLRIGERLHTLQAVQGTYELLDAAPWPHEEEAPVSAQANRSDHADSSDANRDLNSGAPLSSAPRATGPAAGVRVVFIGRNLQRWALESTLRACLQ